MFNFVYKFNKVSEYEKLLFLIKIYRQKYKSLLKMLYPFKFSPQLKGRIWGGTRLRDRFNKEFPKDIKKCGESWELSGVEGNVSVVSNGFLAGNNLQELIEIYMGEIVGDKIYQQYGIEFPLLVKLIDTTDYLSIQVHPDDEMASKLHNAFGKTEMWYILSSEPDSKIITGFKNKITREEYLNIMRSGSLADHLKYESVTPDDFFYIPSGSIHSLGKGILLVEIQQTSDITYRIYDWDRKDANGIGRELHTELAADAIKFNAEPIAREQIPFVKDQPQEIKSSPFFTVNRIFVKGSTERDFYQADTFRIYFCVDGEVQIKSEGNEPISICSGEIALIPAIISSIELNSDAEVKLLEIFIK
jgi:mannose-6-phosphate isomerase